MLNVIAVCSWLEIVVGQKEALHNLCEKEEQKLL